MKKTLSYLSFAVFAFFLFVSNSYANKFDPDSVPCALNAKDFKRTYIGIKGQYEYKEGLNRISTSTGFFDIAKLKPKGKNFCQAKIEQDQCLALFLPESWQKKFGTYSPDFSCVNLRTGEEIPTHDIAYKNKVQERMIKMKCPHSTSITKCAKGTNSKRATLFSKEVLDKNNWVIESVCAGHIREPRYFKGGKVGDTALCALTNDNGEALYKVLIPMEYKTKEPIKKLNGKTILDKPKNVSIKKEIDPKDALYMQDKTLRSLGNTNADLVAITARCTSRVYSLLENSNLSAKELQNRKKEATDAIASWGQRGGVNLPGDKSISFEKRLVSLATYHQKKYANLEGVTGTQADTKTCNTLYQHLGIN